MTSVVSVTQIQVWLIRGNSHGANGGSPLLLIQFIEFKLSCSFARDWVKAAARGRFGVSQ